MLITRDPTEKPDSHKDFLKLYHLSFEIKNKCCQSLQKWNKIELYSPLYGFIKNLQQIHLRDNHMKFKGKKIKSAIPCEQNYVA